jgi:hypothetical protein
MEAQQWIQRCSARLRQQWPRVPAEQLDELAEELRRNLERQAEDPERAAVDWLRQGIPDC